ncbi:MAG: hypothetical protein F2934_12670 [Actinobacteria bacterium]|uniref:Unannotated protein n=1 Tax=freshwater metagenome TaxID=449393 RepID=A0A6J7USB8_9ZZZZ|nr:hypothetical protein [Actinomycetota bacterium]MSZ03562.1 hypothetical protein [Actinomycetota bacterium]MTB07970.1 hypothetical protein [Actinomycetota bacterium]
MDEPGDGVSGNPFSGIPFLGDIAKALSGQGPLSWDAARQFAALTAAEGKPERNVDPAIRFALGELVRIAELHIGSLTGLDTTVAGRSPEIVPVTPGVWADRTLEAYRPLFTELATSLGQGAHPSTDEPMDPALAMIAQFGTLMQPMMLGMAVGSMVGHLAKRAFGQYDLPIPRPAGPEILVVPASIDSFAQDWSLPLDELRLWVVLQEVAGHSVMNVAHIRSTLTSLVKRHAGGFRPNPSAVLERMSDLDTGGNDPMATLQSAFSDPGIMLGAVRSPEQEALAPHLDALVAVVIGYVDHVVDLASARLLPNSAQLAEAVRRRRVEASAQDAFVERLLGLHLDRQAVQRGRAFVDGVVERSGPEGLNRLFHSAESLPTPAEVDAPGLWLARLDLDA